MNQKGQALVELLIFSAALLLFLAASSLLQRWQQVKMQAQHQASFEAFTNAQIEALEPLDISQPAYQANDAISLAYDTYSSRQKLTLVPTISAIDQSRNEAILGQTASTRFIVRAAANGWFKSAWVMPLSWAEKMVLNEQTSIWSGIAATSSMEKTRINLGNSGALWRQQKRKTDRQIKPLIKELVLIDEAWAREPPQLDWLQAWEDSTPDHVLPNRGKDGK